MVLNKIPTFNEVKNWVNNNADVPNADYADSAGDANTINGNTVSDLNKFTQTDSAQTFAESDVSVSHNKTTVSNNSVQLKQFFPGANYTNSIDSPASGYGGSYGFKINPNINLDGLELAISNLNSSNVGSVTIEELSSNTVVADQSVTRGSTVAVGANLVAGTEYSVTLDLDGNLGYSNNVPTVPFDAGDFTITEIITAIGDRWVVFDSVTALTTPTSGSATVSWTETNDVYQWDALNFTRTLDNESVDVFVEESTDGGSTWTEIQGPVSRGDPIQANAGADVRFRIDFARSNTSNNPSLDSIYRRYEL